jgi:hypothetical protein
LLPQSPPRTNNLFPDVSTLPHSCAERRRTEKTLVETLNQSLPKPLRRLQKP